MTLLLYLALLGDSILRIVSSFEFHNKIKDVDVLESSGEVLRWAETETQGKYKERLSELGFFFSILKVRQNLTAVCGCLMESCGEERARLKDA